MPTTITQFINNLLIILGIIIILYGIACLWAVSTEDFNYYFGQIGKFLRRIVDYIAGLIKKLGLKSPDIKKGKEKK